jgi:hypothetical protein
VVASSNKPPAISGLPPSVVTAGQTYSFRPTVEDLDLDTLTYSIVGKPPWATFDSSDGHLQGIPAATDAGVYESIVISVSDGPDTDALPPFSIAVMNTALEISGSPPASVLVGASYTFAPAASDANAGTTLTFALNTTPPWATFNTATGELHGTPSAADVGSYSNLEITVSDGVESVSLPAFSISVQAVAMGSALLSWIPPTLNTDGSPLTNLKGYKIYWGTEPDSYPSSVTVDLQGITSYFVENLTPATYYFVVTARNTDDVESEFSSVATKEIQ